MDLSGAFQGKAKGRMMTKMMAPTKPTPKAAAKVPTKEPPKEQIKEPVKFIPKEPSKEQIKTPTKVLTKETPKELPKDPPKEPTKVLIPKEASKEQIKLQKISSSKSSQKSSRDFDGENTFSLFRRMNEIARKAEKQTQTQAEPEPAPKSEESGDSWSESSGEEVEPTNLIASHGIKEDINKEGMRRGKKGNNLAKPGQSRYQMEDTHLALVPFLKNKNMALFCVFDGHAGKGCSTSLLKEFPNVFKKYWSPQWEAKTDLTQLWKDVYNETDNNLKEHEYEGSTSTTVLVWRCSTNGKRYLQSANLGDSTSFLLRNDKCITLSQDHKPTIPSERERIQAMGIKLEPGQSRLNGLAVSRAFGDHFPKETRCGIISEPYVSPSYELTHKDTRLIVASDGLWDILSGEAAFASIKTVKSTTEASKKLCKQATSARECHDNVTVIVVNLI